MMRPDRSFAADLISATSLLKFSSCLARGLIAVPVDAANPSFFGVTGGPAGGALSFCARFLSTALGTNLTPAD
jgi:hypothetical protein